MLSAPTAKKLEGLPIGFLWQLTIMKVKRQQYGSRRKVALEKVIQGAGTQPLQTYINRRQATVAKSVDLRPTFEVCSKVTV